MTSSKRGEDLWQNEETIDQILLHCDKKRVTWKLLLSFFGVAQVFLSSFRLTLEGWRVGGFCGQEEEGGLKARLIMPLLV